MRFKRMSGNTVWPALFLVGALAAAGCLPSKDAQNSPPRISVDSLRTSVLETEVYRDTLRRADGQSGKLEYKLVQGPHGAVVEDSVVTWWAASGIGDFQFVASAVDNETGLQFVYTWFVHVDRQNHPPGFLDSSSAMPDFAIVGERYEDTLRVFDINGDLPIFRDPAKFPWLSFRDSILIIRPGPADTGWHRVSVIAEDGKGGSDTLSWTLRISKDDGEICGFRNFETGTSWVYRSAESPTLSMFSQEHFDSLRLESVSQKGDTGLYDFRYISKSQYYPDKDRSFTLSLAGGVIRTWTTAGEEGEGEVYFQTDCAKEYEVGKAVVLGDSALVYIRTKRTDFLGNPVNREIGVQGIGLVYRSETVKGQKLVANDTLSLIRFNDRNVRIRSLDPFEMVYE
jgi:hypothetical protein